MNNPIQSLQIHIHKVDGSVETFTQSEAGQVNRILNEFQPVRIFTREKIIIADSDSLTSFPTSQVVRIDLVSEPSPHPILSQGIVNALELAETEFRALLQNPELGERWHQARARQASVVAFLDVEMAGQQPLFLASEVPLSPPVDRPEAMLHPLYPLTIPALCFRMRNGGVAVLNLFHLKRFTLFPSSQPAPVEAWSACRAKNMQHRHPAQGFRGPADSQPLPSFLQLNGRMNLAPGPGSQDENGSTIKGEYQ